MRTRALLSIVAAGLGAAGACGDDLAAPPDAARPMHLSGVSPARGPLPGGTTIVLGGDGFDPAAPPRVLVGLFPATEVGVVDAYTLTATTPAGQMPGPVDVVVAGGAGFARVDLGFTYDPLPAITSVTPAVGAAAGGTQVTIHGSGFVAHDAGRPTVRFGGRVAGDVAVLGDDTLLATTPPGNAFAPVPVTVENHAGRSPPWSFLYTAPGLIVGANYYGPPVGMFYLDGATGLVTEIRDLTLPPWQNNAMHSLATDGKLLWGTTYYYSDPPLLFTFDPITQAATPIGPVVDPNGNGSGMPAPVDCLDLEVAKGTLYCTIYGALYTIDRSTAQATRVATLSVPPYGAALATVGGTTYAVMGGCCTATTFAPIDLATGTIGTPRTIMYQGGPLYVYLGNATGYAGAIDLIATYGFEGGVPSTFVQDGSVLRIDVDAGVATLVGRVPFQPTALSAFE
jgi:hypothetical protein